MLNRNGGVDEPTDDDDRACDLLRQAAGLIEELRMFHESTPLDASEVARRRTLAIKLIRGALLRLGAD